MKTGSERVEIASRFRLSHQERQINEKSFNSWRKGRVLGAEHCRLKNLKGKGYWKMAKYGQEGRKNVQGLVKIGNGTVVQILTNRGGGG